jgi:hypothetical protein
MRERVQTLFNEVWQERLGSTGPSSHEAKQGILVVSAAEEADPVQQTLRVTVPST